jgi:hypothetical protein
MSPKDETFARALADGKKAAVAYQEAGFTGGAANARRKKAHPAVKQRILEILAQREQAVIQATGAIAGEIIIERQNVIRNIVRIAEAAEADGDYGAALRANIELGKDIGMFVERSVSVNFNADLDAIPDAEVDNEIRRLRAKLARASGEEDATAFDSPKPH